MFSTDHQLPLKDSLVPMIADVGITSRDLSDFLKDIIVLFRDFQE
jgi:hypothetical protein